MTELVANRPLGTKGAYVPAILLGALIFCVSLVGIYSRPLGFLAAIWPANAVLLGLLVMRPSLAGPAGWLAAIAGYLLAGQLAGDTLAKNLWLTTANISGVAVGYGLFRLLDREHRRLRTPSGVLQLFLIVMIASASAAVTGSAVAPALFQRAELNGIPLWFTSELTNYMIMLPVMLTVPDHWRQSTMHEVLGGLVTRPRRLLPGMALCFSFLMTVVIGGPGSIGFVVPALLWCSLSYSLPLTALLVSLYCLAMMSIEAIGLVFPIDTYDFVDGIVSFRLGVALLALGPLTVASITASQRALLERLDHVATTDALTGILARRAFLERGAAALARWRSTGRIGVALLMIDIDHFKAINDRHGHALGDETLVAVTRCIRDTLRADDAFGRLGGEEFAALLLDIRAEDAAELAQQCRRAVEALPPLYPDMDGTTISIGIVHRTVLPEQGLGALLRMADTALYHAKHAGRNRVAVYKG